MSYNLSSINATGLDTLYVGVVTLQPWITPMFLFFEFVVIMLTGVYQQSRRIGYSNIPMWGSIAGLVTTTSAFILTGITGIINIYTITICISVTAVFSIIFFVTDLE